MAKRKDAIDLDREWQESAGQDGVRIISDWLARSSIWVDPEVYREVQVVFPRTRRLRPKEKFRSVGLDGLAVWRNEPAAFAFWKACEVSTGGSSPRSIKHGVVCHLYEDSTHDPQHFTNLANLTAVPKALESFTEWEPIRSLLKWKAFELFGYRGPHGTSPARTAYVPVSWPGVRQLDPIRRTDVVRRLTRLRDERPGYIPRQTAAGQ
jgi:hypothetical protein